MKLYTRGGDGGDTALFGGRRVKKSAPRVEAYGEVDELNSILGVVRAGIGEADLDEQLSLLQSELFDLGGVLATPEPEAREKLPGIGDGDVERLERWIDGLEAGLEPLRNFVLPGGAPAAAQLHHARTVCRRAERRVVALGEDEPVPAELLRYLNRLSDLLFAMAREVNRRAGVAEPLWVGRER